MNRMIDADRLKDKLVGLNDYRKVCEIINKEIDNQIKERSNSKYEVDGARMLLKKYKTDRSGVWVVTLEEIDGAFNKSSAYKQIISAKSKDDAIEYIEAQIATLQALLNTVKESTHENKC